MKAYENLRQTFREAADCVFTQILRQDLPSTISIELLLNSLTEFDGKSKTVRLAAFHSGISDADNLHFLVREMVLRMFLQKEDEEDEIKWLTIVFHELLHAADHPVLDHSFQLLMDTQIKAFYSNPYALNTVEYSLLLVLQLMSTYRAEGVAILGSKLLTSQQYGESSSAIKLFSKVFNYTMTVAQVSLEYGHLDKAAELEEEVFPSAYDVAPYILLKVLAQLERIPASLSQRAIRALDGGKFDLSEEEVFSIIRASLHTSFPDYIGGVLLLGEEIAPLQPFLALCGQWRQGNSQSDIEAFSQLARRPGSLEAYKKTMEQIMGCFIPEKELDELYSQFKRNKPDPLGHSEIAEKVDKLYSFLKSDGSPANKQIAQWALTYFFDSVDVIQDNIQGLGFIDDVLVMDRALKLIES